MKNREIKFRAWDNFNGEMIYSKDHKTLRDFFLSYQLRIEGGNKVILEQFTGLTEISLNERGGDIYENDVIEWNIFPYDNISGEKTGETVRVSDTVKFSNGCFKLEKRGGLLCTILEPHREVKIISNIHELKGENQSHEQ